MWFFVSHATWAIKISFKKKNNNNKTKENIFWDSICIWSKEIKNNYLIINKNTFIFSFDGGTFLPPEKELIIMFSNDMNQSIDR